MLAQDNFPQAGNPDIPNATNRPCVAGSVLKGFIQICALKSKLAMPEEPAHILSLWLDFVEVPRPPPPGAPNSPTSTTIGKSERAWRRRGANSAATCVLRANGLTNSGAACEKCLL